MTSLSDAKNSVYNYLAEMGLSPTGLKVTSFDTESEPLSWLLEGRFQEGFMGTHYTFNVKFNSTTKNVTKMDVKEVSGSLEGYA